MSTQSGNPYVVHDAPDKDDFNTPGLLEVTFVASHAHVNLTPTLMAHAEALGVKGDPLGPGIPGPTIRVKKGQSFVVRFKNELDHASGLHWHGIEMANKKDGTPFTQRDVIPSGGTYLYKLHAPRAGLFWYHPHHHTSTNQTFRGMYGAIIVTDDVVENALIDDQVQNGLPPIIPPAADTLTLVLSDTTVCKAPADTVNSIPSQNDPQTYPTGLPWAGPSGVLNPTQAKPWPITLCELEPLDDHGDVLTTIVPYGDGEIPNIQKSGPGRVNEGQTVLTNGIQVDATTTYPVTSGQGLRLQIINCATIRFFRLRLTTSGGTPIPLYRIGGEGGLLKNPIQETNIWKVAQPLATFAFQQGEILLPAGSRADVVAVIPQGLAPNDVLTLWTLDYPRLGPTGGPWCNLPTVPVAHFKVNGLPDQSFTFDELIDLRPNSVPNIQLIDLAPLPTNALLNPANFGFNPQKKGKTVPPLDVIVLDNGATIDGQQGTHDVTGDYELVEHMEAARYAKVGDVLELKVRNESDADHPFHLHGFSMQPIALDSDDINLPNHHDYPLEYRDNINVPSKHTLTFRVHIEPRHLVDDVTPGGAMGRWLFHCHIFFHAHLGMMSELVIGDGIGRERPYIDVFGSWAYSDNSAPAERHGTYEHPDGLPNIDLSDPTTFTVTDSAPPNTLTHSFTAHPPNPGGTWDWQATSLADGIYYVYITVKDARGYLDQCVFRVKFGGVDDGADNGDPHIHTIDGKRYDFQAAGEFTVLRDREEGFEIQARQTPVRAANPVTDDYTGLRSCVSVNTAVAVRAGCHVVSYQPWREPGQLQIFLDGKPFAVPGGGIDLDGHWLSMPVIGDAVSMRIDFANGGSVIARPWLWESYGIPLMNIDVTNLTAEEGIMAPIPPGTWLPCLANGGTVGSMPTDPHDRFLALYRTFADSWRVTNKTSLFVYEHGASTRTYTDREWPVFERPCTLQPEFEVPGANPPKKGLTIAQAEKVCARVTDKGLHQDCVFDVATTGDIEFARAYEVAEKLRHCATRVRVRTDKSRSKRGEEIVVTATVTDLWRGRRNEGPRGIMTFFVDDRKAGKQEIDERGQAKIILRRLTLGEHRIRATYSPSRECRRESSSSPIRTHIVVRAKGK